MAQPCAKVGSWWEKVLELMQEEGTRTRTLHNGRQNQFRGSIGLGGSGARDFGRIGDERIHQLPAQEVHQGCTWPADSVSGQMVRTSSDRFASVTPSRGHLQLSQGKRNWSLPMQERDRVEGEIEPVNYPLQRFPKACSCALMSATRQPLRFRSNLWVMVTAAHAPASHTFHGLRCNISRRGGSSLAVGILAVPPS